MSSRLFGVGLAGFEPTAAEREILAAHPPWGVILFRRNIQSVGQLRSLIDEVRALGARVLFLDQEGGPVDRLGDLLGPSPSFQRAARAGYARRAGELAGAMLAWLGFDVNLAPVVDRGIEGAGALILGERSAAKDPAEIIHAAGAFLAGLHERGIGGCLKHFPGLGRARLDSHRALPVIEQDRHEEALDLAPFDALMEEAGAIMISHAAGPDGIPASLSESWATERLRDVLGFGGAAFSDDLEMGALDAFGGLRDRCAAAAAAGCDLLLVCRQIELYPACVEAVESVVPVARRAEAAERLEDYARRLGKLRDAAPRVEESVETLAAAVRAFDESLR